MSAPEQAAVTVEEMARRDPAAFEAWKNSPSGLAAMGFGRVNCAGGAEALRELAAEKDAPAAGRR